MEVVLIGVIFFAKDAEPAITVPGKFSIKENIAARRELGKTRLGSPHVSRLALQGQSHPRPAQQHALPVLADTTLNRVRFVPRVNRERFRTLNLRSVVPVQADRRSRIGDQPRVHRVKLELHSLLEARFLLLAQTVPQEVFQMLKDQVIARCVLRIPLTRTQDLLRVLRALLGLLQMEKQVKLFAFL